MHFSLLPRPRGVVGLHDVPALDRLHQPHAVTVADIAVACAALDYGCAAWSSHQVDVVVAREEEGSRAVVGQLSHRIDRAA
jgi:hypothetical protein